MIFSFIINKPNLVDMRSDFSGKIFEPKYLYWIRFDYREFSIRFSIRIEYSELGWFGSKINMSVTSTNFRWRNIIYYGRRLLIFLEFSLNFFEVFFLHFLGNLQQNKTNDNLFNLYMINRDDAWNFSSVLITRKKNT